MARPPKLVMPRWRVVHKHDIFWTVPLLAPSDVRARLKLRRLDRRLRLIWQIKLLAMELLRI
jgi:hypothetical protein